MIFFLTPKSASLSLDRRKALTLSGMELSEIEEFSTDEQFSAAQRLVYRMVAEGQLAECGLDASEPFRFVEVFERKDGARWHLACPIKPFEVT